MVCEKCGAEIAEGCTYCGICGTKSAAREEKAVACDEKAAACEEKAVACDEKAAACEEKAVACDEKSATLEEKAATETSASIKCKKCGKFFYKQLVVCPFCGETSGDLSKNLSTDVGNFGVGDASGEPKRKFCKSCGNEVPAKAEFCPGCGQHFDSNTTVYNNSLNNPAVGNAINYTSGNNYAGGGISAKIAVLFVLAFAVLNAFLTLFGDWFYISALDYFSGYGAKSKYGLLGIFEMMDKYEKYIGDTATGWILLLILAAIVTLIFIIVLTVKCIKALQSSGDTLTSVNSRESMGNFGIGANIATLILSGLMYLTVWAVNSGLSKDFNYNVSVISTGDAASLIVLCSIGGIVCTILVRRRAISDEIRINERDRIARAAAKKTEIVTCGNCGYTGAYLGACPKCKSYHKIYIKSDGKKIQL